MSNSSSSKVPGWLWLVAGVALGALVMFLMRLSELDPAFNYLQWSERAPDSSATAEVEPAAQDSAPRRFDFYHLLRDSEVPVTVTPNERKPSTQPEMDYLLQVASFRSAADANEVRAQLMLMNLSAWIEKSQSQSGQTWHRVIVGPFSTRSQMAKAKSTLLSNRYEALMLKRERAN